MKVKGTTVVELIIVLVLILILALAGGGVASIFRDRTADEAAKASMLQVMNAQWSVVQNTGSFTTNEEELDIIAPTRITQQASERPDYVSVLLQDGELRLAVKSETGACFAQKWEDPATGTGHTDITLPGQCSAAAVP